MLAERGDLLPLMDILRRVERRILGTLLGLNRVYAASVDFKWAFRIVADLELAPTDLPARLPRVLRIEAGEAVNEAHRLTEETICLVERHLPGFDTATVRARLTQRRPTPQDRQWAP